MRNLKRVLSLALATVMLLGMMIVGTSAANANSFTDMGDIDHREDVSVLAAVGVVNGVGDGSYNPTGKFTRAEMATLVIRLTQGTNVDPALFADADIFSDCDGFKWAKGYINLANTLGYVQGDGQGHFYPERELTVGQSAKLLLNALGVKTSDGDNYMEAMNEAAKLGLFGDLTGINAITPMTREMVAVMAYEAMFYSPSGANSYTVTTADGVPHVFDSAADAYFFAQSNSITGANAVTVSTAKDSLAAKIFKLNRNTGGVDDFGRPATTYTLDGKAMDVVSDAGEAYVTYTASTANADILKDLKGLKIVMGNDTAGTVVDDETNVNKTMPYILNGDSTQKVAAASTTIVEKIANLTANGKIVNIYVSGDTISKIVVINKSVATLVGDPVTRVEGKETQIRIPGVISSWTNIDDVYGWEDLAKDDVVLYVQAANGNVYLEKALSFDGTATAKRGTTQLRIDGVYYAGSDLTGKLFTVSSFDAFNTEYTFYQDNNGSIVKAVPIGTASATTQYAVIVNHGFAGTGTEIGGTSYGQATLLFTDGTTETVKVDKYDNTTITRTNYTSMTKDTICTYTERDGTYTLKSVASTPSIDQMKAGNAALKADKSLVGNDSTIVLVKGGTAARPTFTVYTGVKNMPTLEDENLEGVCIANGKLVSLVYVSASSAAVTPTGIYFYVPANTSAVYVAAVSGGMGAHYEIEAYVDGELTTVYMNEDVKTAVSAGELYIATEQDSKGIVTELDITTSANKLNTSVATTDTGIKVAGKGTLYVGSNLVYNIDEDTAVYYITDNGESLTPIDYTELTADETDDVHVKAAPAAANGSIHADAVYVKAVNSGTKTVSTVAVKVNGQPASLAGGNSATAATVNANGAKIGQTVTIAPTAPAGGRIENIRITQIDSDTTDARVGSTGFKVNATTDSSKVIEFTYTVVAEDGTTAGSENTFTLTLGTVNSNEAKVTKVVVTDSSISNPDTGKTNEKTITAASGSLGTVTIADGAVSTDPTITLTLSTGASVKAVTSSSEDHKVDTTGEAITWDKTTNNNKITLGKAWTGSSTLTIKIEAADGTEATYTLTVEKAAAA